MLCTACQAAITFLLGFDDATPLHIAASRWCDNCVDNELSGGAVPDALDGAERTPLYTACDKVDVNDRKGLVCVERLLRDGASPCKMMCDGRTPLHVAARWGHPNIIQTLLEWEADPSIYDEEFGQSPLHYAAKNGHPECAKALLGAGADPNAKDDDDDTPLDLAEDHPEVADVLRAHGALDAEERLSDEPAEYRDYRSCPPLDDDATPM